MRGRLYNMQKARVPNPKGVNQHSEVEYHFDTQPTTADRLSAELGVSAPTIKRDGKFADAVNTLRAVLPDIDKRVMASCHCDHMAADTRAYELPAHSSDTQLSGGTFCLPK